MSSAVDNLGPHLLGRLPSPPDARDYRLEDYLTAPSNADLVKLLDAGVGHLKATTVGYAGHGSAWQSNKSTQWWQGLDPIAQVRAALAGYPPPPSPTGDVKWDNPDAPLDQGQQGTCVGHGCAQWGNVSPINDHFTHSDALDIYYQATIYDGSPDDPRAPGGGQQGASVRSGMKALQKKGRLSAYAVTQDTAAVRAWVTTKGPVVFGTNWMNDMFNPNSLGYLSPTGGIAGGHCYTCVGDLVSESAGLFINSWGPNWSPLHGYFKMKWSDVQALLNQNGEAWTAVELPV